MKLLELEPRWFCLEKGGPRVGLTFLCSHCRTQRLASCFITVATRRSTMFTFGLTCTAARISSGRFARRRASTFSPLTPSVDASRRGHWHGSHHKRRGSLVHLQQGPVDFRLGQGVGQGVVGVGVDDAELVAQRAEPDPVEGDSSPRKAALSLMARASSIPSRARLNQSSSKRLMPIQALGRTPQRPSCGPSAPGFS